MKDNSYQNAIFLDETALRAFMDPNDEKHERARELFVDLDDLERDFVSTSYIVFETHEWLRNHFGEGPAETFLDVMEEAMSRGKLSLISGNEQLEQEANNLLNGCPQFGFSFGEAVNAVVVLAYQIRRIFSFNRHYESLVELQPGLRLIPSR